ncbi:MAG: IS5 family transposase [Fimbriimonas sp.]
MDLTEAQWALVGPLLPEPKVREDGKGRRWSEPRDILNGILWILRTGAPWKDLPERYPPKSTCHRRFQTWAEDGTLLSVLKALAQDLEERGGIDLSECFVDATFASAKKGAGGVGKTKRGKGTKIMAITDRSGLPVATWTGSASPHEITLLEDTLDAKFTVDFPIKLIGDRAYDSDKHDAWIKEQYGTELIAPHNPRRKTKTQDGRPLRRSKRRWKVERLFAWLQNFRRITTRWERRLANYNAFVHLGCILILLRQLPEAS